MWLVCCKKTDENIISLVALTWHKWHRGTNMQWFTCWFQRYMNCLFVCLLNFLHLFLFLSFFLTVLSSVRWFLEWPIRIKHHHKVKCTVSGYDCWKRNGLSRHRKFENVSAETTSSGSSFQIQGPETLNAWLPTVDSQNIGTTRRLELAERSTCFTSLVVYFLTYLLFRNRHVLFSGRMS